MSEDQILCEVYTSDRAEETYLFVEQSQGLSSVPEELLARFPEPRIVTRFKLSPERTLARSNPVTVLESIKCQGYYLQLPPPKDAHLAALSDRNEKLPRQ